MPDPDAQWAEAGRWFAKAMEDRQAAERLMTGGPALLDPAAYHCQQAGEKLLKGLLAAIGEVIPNSHDLRHLAALVAPMFPALVEAIAKVADLTPWGTTTRYPDLEGGLGVMPQDIGDALIDLDHLSEVIRSVKPRN